MADPTQMADHFSLAHFLQALEGFSPPDEPFDPQGAWENAYTIYESSAGTRPIGAIRIARTPEGNGQARLQVQYRKAATGGSLHCRMELTCRTDALATPVEWTVETVVHDTEDQPIEDTRFSEAGTALDDALEVRIGDRKRRLPVDAPYTLHWSLFDAVQRLGREAQEPLTFTLVDRLNYEVKPGHTLAPRKAAEVELGGKRTWKEERHDLEVGTVYRPVPSREGAVRTQMQAYEQFGEGILPIVYWVDERGRLLFVLSGLIGYVLDPDAQV
jgi:hypothetical protein